MKGKFLSHSCLLSIGRFAISLYLALDCPKLRNKGKGILPSPHQTSQYNRNAFKPLSSGPISAFSSHSAAASSNRTFNRTAITHEEIQSLVAQQIQQLLGTSLESQNSAAMSVMNTEDASPSSTLLQNETPSQSDPPAISDDVDPTTSQVEIRVELQVSSARIEAEVVSALTFPTKPLSVLGCNIPPIEAVIATPTMEDGEGKKCFSKWKGTKKINRIYADWMDDLTPPLSVPSQVKS
ncbi:hypothetical protein RHSIM_Rhsim10G0200700 [Rhododendron simsii]|uniref:Uncharacterized protein n=1 Tax=Rhododendron simsii TaxID=118357 RepID=A0A834GAA0_RHOSS|nr:hypothetical protein RHSIM_Rhsim10G0200700 [Rhododendron simsii]